MPRDPEHPLGSELIAESRRPETENVRAMVCLVLVAREIRPGTNSDAGTLVEEGAGQPKLARDTLAFYGFGVTLIED